MESSPPRPRSPPATEHDPAPSFPMAAASPSARSSTHSTGVAGGIVRLTINDVASLLALLAVSDTLGLSLSDAITLLVDQPVSDAPTVAIADAAAVLVNVIPVDLHTPGITTTYDFGVRIQENFAGIKPMPLPRVMGAVHPKAVFNVIVVESKHHHGEDVPDPELIGKGDLRHWFRLTLFE